MSNSNAKVLGIVIAVFAVVGVGIGLTGFLGLSGLMPGGGSGDDGSMMAAFMGALLALMGVLVTFLLGPVVAAVSGLLSGLSLQDHTGGAIIGGVGSFVGFYVMVIVAFVVIMAAIPSTGGGAGGGGGGGGSLALGDMLTTILKAGIPSGIVGALSGVLGVEFVG